MLIKGRPENYDSCAINRKLGCADYHQQRLATNDLPPLSSGGIVRVAGYIRVSSERQKQTSHSPREQEDLIRAYAQETHGEGGYTLKFYCDLGMSGTLGWERGQCEGNGFRPQLAQLAEDVLNDQVDEVVVLSRDRLFRDTVLDGMYERFVLQGGEKAILVSLNEPGNFQSDEGRLVGRIHSLFADEYVKGHKRRTKASKAQRRSQGLWTGKLNFGWRAKPGGPDGRVTLERHPEHWQVVRQGFDWALEPQTPTWIMHEMNRRGLPSPGKTPEWSMGNVLAMLKSPLHAGLIKDGDEERQGVHWEQRIVEPEERERVLQLLARRSRSKRYRSVRQAQPLWGVAHCRDCLQFLSVVDMPTRPSYRCPGDQEATGDETAGSAEPAGDGSPAGRPLAGLHRRPCPGWTKQAAAVNRVLLELLKQVCGTADFLRLAASEAQDLLLREGIQALEGQRQQLEEALKRLKARRSKLVAAYLADSVAKEDYEAHYAQLQADIEQLEGEIEELSRRIDDRVGEEELLEQVREVLPRVPEIWASMDPEQQRHLLEELTEYVILERRSGGQALLRLKVHHLPELSAVVPHGKTRAAGYHEGVPGLTNRELAYLELRRRGMTNEEIATHWGYDIRSARRIERMVLDRVQVGTIAEALERARERLEAEAERPGRSMCPVVN